MGRLTTHVLDTASGKPAAGLKIELFRQGETAPFKTIHTNADGRADGPILEGADFAAGQYELRFHAGAYLRAIGTAHYHVPLLLSPYGYSTYRGS